MKQLIEIIEKHFWYPISLLYIGVIGVSLGMLIGFLL